VRAGWAAPGDGGLSILSYQVLIFVPMTEQFVTDPGCSSGDPSITECNFGMSYLVNTYGFVYGDLFQFIGRATNALGTADYSAVNTAGPIAFTVPTFAYPVTEGSNTDATSIDLLWTLITQPFHTGGVQVTSYDIWWDQGGSTWTELVNLPCTVSGCPTEYIATSLMNNRTY